MTEGGSLASGRGWLRGIGWTMVTLGAVLLLYLVYLLWFTGFETAEAQEDLLEQWELEVGEVVGDPAMPTRLPGDGEATDGEATPSVPSGAAIASVTFEDAEGGPPPVAAEPLLVVEGVTADDLRSGPGHYPSTPGPGADGNFAISGHRTTYGAPFYDLDDLAKGDLVHVTDRDGTLFTYRVVEQQVVTPTDVWVIGPDPLGNGTPLMTMTTCHPRFSDAQRLIVFAELVA